jgi:hypothetical protein
MKRTFVHLLILFSIFLTACGRDATPPPTEAPPVTTTPDLCSAESLPAEAARANKLMREFDDYSALASNTPQSQLVVLIPEMQRILRETEDLSLPPCLQTLKNLEMAHMNLVIQTLMAFLNNTDVQVINAGISQARELHSRYDIELARLLGITLVAPPTATPGGDANVAPSATAAVVAFVTNPGPGGVNLRSAPGLNAPEIGILDGAASTSALGKSTDDQWLLVEIPGLPGQTAWVYAQLVQLSVPIAQLPVVNQ